MESPNASRHGVSPFAAASPSGPEERITSPTIVLPSRYVPQATIAARQEYTAPVCVLTALTAPFSVRYLDYLGLLDAQFFLDLQA